MSEKFFRKGPQNAAKNKPHIPTDAELASVPASDERKTVILDEDLEGVDLEDRVWLYWKRNRNFIIFTIVAAFAIVIGVQGWKMYKASSGDTLAAAYAAANTPEKLAEFAKAHSGTALAGVAQLQNADTAFNAGKFADAQKLYSEAAKNLGEETLAGRAKIGMAMSAISAGDSAKGMEALEKVYKEGSVYSAQAGYLLGLAKVQNGKVDEAKNLFKEISSNNNNGVFALLANQELSNLN